MWDPLIYINLYNSYQRNFVFDTSLHQFPCLLTNILDNPGYFCKIAIQIHNDIKLILIVNNLRF